MKAMLIGVIAVLIWGVSLPIMRVLYEQIGALGTIGGVFAGCGLLGVISHFIRRQPFPDRVIFHNPYLYGRWIFFVLHESLINIAIFIVQKEHLPFVILINYLWPSAIIFCSVAIAGVPIARPLSFYLGIVIVVISLALEILGPGGFSSALFVNTADCISYAMALAGAISWGLYCALSKKAGDLTGGGSLIPLFQLTLGLVLPISFLPAFSASWQPTGLGVVLLAGYCIFQFIAYQSWDYGMRKGNVVVLSLCADFIPWISLASANIFLGLKIGGNTIISVVLLVAGAMITRYGTLQQRQAEDFQA